MKGAFNAGEGRRAETKGLWGAVARRPSLIGEPRPEGSVSKELNGFSEGNTQGCLLAFTWTNAHVHTHT